VLYVRASATTGRGHRVPLSRYQSYDACNCNRVALICSHEERFSNFTPPWKNPARDVQTQSLLGLVRRSSSLLLPLSRTQLIVESCEVTGPGWLPHDFATRAAPAHLRFTGGAGPQITSCLKGPKEPCWIRHGTYPYVTSSEPSLGELPASVRCAPGR